MADVFTKRKRSEVMARIRARGNRDTELALARLMRRAGITGWRRQQVLRVKVRCSKFDVRSSGVSILPDFVFRRQWVAVFVDGCFWHGCPLHSPPPQWLRKSSMPATAGTRTDAKQRRTGKRFWREKLVANKRRDRSVNRLLRKAGWRVVRIWEHEIPQGTPERAERKRRRLVRKIQAALSAFATHYPSACRPTPRPWLH